MFVIQHWLKSATAQLLNREGLLFKSSKSRAETQESKKPGVLNFPSRILLSSSGLLLAMCRQVMKETPTQCLGQVFGHRELQHASTWSLQICDTLLETWSTILLHDAIHGDILVGLQCVKPSLRGQMHI